MVPQNMGFVGGKIPCPYGPSAGFISLSPYPLIALSPYRLISGAEGLRKNVEFFKGWREKVGPDFPLILTLTLTTLLYLSFNNPNHSSVFIFQ